MFITGANGTGDKLFNCVNDTADKFFTGAADTGDKTVLLISACLRLNMKKAKFQYINVDCT
jgi:hypothetical protein